MRKILFLLLTLSPFIVKADKLVISLLCFEESDFNNTTQDHDILVVDVKSTDDNMGYAVTKYISNEDANFRRGLTYFKAGTQAQQENHPNFVLFTTRQNPEDLGRDADFLGVDFTNVGTSETTMYRAVVGRGHDNVTNKKAAYFCSVSK